MPRPCGMVCRNGRSDGAREQAHEGNREVGSGHRQDGAQPGEGRRDQRLTHHVAAATDGGDTVGADFRLEVRL